MPKVVFMTRNGQRTEVEAKAGQSILEVARSNNISLEGACDGALVCSMCHVIIDDTWYNKIPKATAQEEDALDLVSGLKPTSRLACQIIMTNDLDGIIINIPRH